MVTREELNKYDEREILIQLRMAVAVLEARTADLPSNARMAEIEAEHRWLKKLLFAATPAGPILATTTVILSQIFG